MNSRTLLSLLYRNSNGSIRRLCSQARKLTNAEVSKKRSEMFSEEKKRQLAHITRIEKIQVEHLGPPEKCRLIMNKGLSSPFNCAMHIQELLMQRSVLALVNGQPWDMHRPLEEDCTLEFLHFKENELHLCNEAFWRTGSFLLGYILERAFQDDFYVELCSFPKPNVRSGSFVYDADLKIPDWKPTQNELLTMGRIASRLGHEDVMFERLTVDASVALEMFADNRFKTEQIPSIAAQSTTGNDVTLYRMLDHVDISRGPLIGSTQLLNRFNVTAVHDIESPEFGPLKRVQGIAMPKQIAVHFWTYELLSERASKLNKAQIPRLQSLGASPLASEQRTLSA